MGGADFGTSLGGDGTLLFGVLAGYFSSEVDLNGSATDIEYEGGSLGAYATYLNGGFFADLLGKVDFYDVDYDAARGGGDDADGTNWGLRGDVGYATQRPPVVPAPLARSTSRPPEPPAGPSPRTRGTPDRPGDRAHPVGTRRQLARPPRGTTGPRVPRGRPSTPDRHPRSPGDPIGHGSRTGVPRGPPDPPVSRAVTPDPLVPRAVPPVPRAVAPVSRAVAPGAPASAALPRSVAPARPAPGAPRSSEQVPVARAAVDRAVPSAEAPPRAPAGPATVAHRSPTPAGRPERARVLPVTPRAVAPAPSSAHRAPALQAARTPLGLQWPPTAPTVDRQVASRHVASEAPGTYPAVGRAVADVSRDPLDAGSVAVDVGIARRVDPTEVRFAAPGAPTPEAPVARAATVVADRAPQEPAPAAPGEVVAVGAAAPTGQDLGTLADELWERLELRLRTDLMLERERRGTWPDA